MNIARLLLLLIATAALPTQIGAQSAACLSHTATVRGELRVVNTRHPNGQRIEAMQLVFRPSICIVLPPLGGGSMQRLDVREMHIVPQPQFVARLKGALGQAVTAHGDISEPHTAWHQGDAIMFDAVILRIEPQ